MSETPSTTLTDKFHETISILSERIDPMISRVDEGGLLTNEELRQVFHTLHALAKVAGAASVALDASEGVISELEDEITALKGTK